MRHIFFGSQEGKRAVKHLANQVGTVAHVLAPEQAFKHVFFGSKEGFGKCSGSTDVTFAYILDPKLAQRAV